MNVYLVIWDWMNNGLPITNANSMMVKQIYKVVPTTVDKIAQVLERQDVAQLIYGGVNTGRYMQWELIFRPDNGILEEAVKGPSLDGIQVNWDATSVCLRTEDRVRWVHRGDGPRNNE